MCHSRFSTCSLVPAWIVPSSVVYQVCIADGSGEVAVASVALIPVAASHAQSMGTCHIAPRILNGD